MKVPRNAYINQALNFCNKLNQRQLLRRNWARIGFCERKLCWISNFTRTTGWSHCWMKIEKFCIYLADLNPQFGTEPGKWGRWLSYKPIYKWSASQYNYFPVTTNVHQSAQLLRVHLTPHDNHLTAPSDILVTKFEPLITSVYWNELKHWLNCSANN